jgi:predicted alpha/beta superfamily hydrolase
MTRTVVWLVLSGSLVAGAGVSTGIAQQPRADTALPVALPNTHQRILRSRINGRAYLLQIALPAAYTNAKPGELTRYPTLYLLDGNLDFPLFFASLQFRPINLILVGVSDADNQAQRRSFDYTPPLTATDSAYFRGPSRPPLGLVGGAPLFLRVLREEVIPLIDGAYRTSDDRGIEGSSFGGLFVAYAMLEAPDLFTRYAMISPSLFYPWGREKGIILAGEPEFARRHPTFPKHVFLSAGSRLEGPGPEGPSMIGVMWQFADQLCRSLSAGNYKGLDLAVETLANEGHGSLLARLHVLGTLYPPDSAMPPARGVMQHCR